MRVFVTLFVLVWGSVTLVADWSAVAGFVRAVRSGGWATADGVVTRCELVRQGRGSRLELAYTFTAGGREYTGHDYQADPATRATGDRAMMLATFPAGTPVTVSYDPDNPADAVLDPGTKPAELAALFPILTFNLLTAGAVVAWWRVVVRWRRFDPSRHVRPTADGLAVRLNGLTRLEGVVVVLFGVSVVGTVGVTVLLHSFAQVAPSWWVDGGAWVVLLAYSADWRRGRAEARGN